MFAGLSGAFGYPPPIHQRPIVLEDGRWFAAGSTHGTVEVWNLPERRRILEFGHYRGRVAPVEFSPDGTRLIVLDQGSRLMLAGDRTRHAVGVWDVEIASDVREERLVAMDEALARLEREDPKKAEVVKLRYLVGMTNRETAEAMSLSEATVERHWAFAKAWLFSQIQAAR